MSDISPSPLELIARADNALVRTVDALPADAFVEASLLPGWTRGHVIAHLALNAEALERVVRSFEAGTPEAMYESDQARDDDIDALAQEERSEIRNRLMSSTTCLSRVLEASRTIGEDALFERTPGGVMCPVADIAVLRLREVEIHHADLGVDYGPDDWSTAFAVMLLDSLTARPFPVSFVAAATDVERQWHCGNDADPQGVSGGAAAIGWWLAGRGNGEGLTSSTGVLPRIDPW